MPHQFFALRSSMNTRRVTNNKQQPVRIASNRKQSTSGESGSKNTLPITSCSNDMDNINNLNVNVGPGGDCITPVKEVISSEHRKPRVRTKSAFELLAEQSKIDEAKSIAAEKEQQEALKLRPTSSKQNKHTTPNINIKTSPIAARASKRKARRSSNNDQVLNKSPKKSIVSTESTAKQLTTSALTFLNTDIGDERFQVASERIKDIEMQTNDKKMESKSLQIPTAAKSIFVNSPKTSNSLRSIPKIAVKKNIKSIKPMDTQDVKSTRKDTLFENLNYKVLDCDRVLLSLSEGDALTLRGYSKVKVIRGAVSCYGTQFSVAAEFDLYSERSTFYQQLKCIDCCQTDSYATEDQDKDCEISDYLTSETSCCVLLMSSSSDLNFTAQVLRSCKGVSSLFQGDDVRGHRLAELPLEVVDPRSTRIFNQSQVFAEVDFSKFKKMVFCGGVGGGKSTMTKYVVNKLLSSGNAEVAYLDFDLGQSELGPSGFTSLYIVDKPLLGLRMTHLQTPYMSHFYGNTNPSDIDKYIQQVESLSIIALQLNIPLVVNTCGWFEGMGLELLVHVIQNVAPDAVFQLRKSEDKPSKEVLDPDYVNTFTFKRAPRKRDLLDFYHWDHCAFNSNFGHNDIGGLHLTSNTKRSMSLAAYFSPRFTLTPSDPKQMDPGCSSAKSAFTLNELFTSARPYTLPWTAVVISSDAMVNKKNILYALDCRLVGLSILNDFEYHTKDRRAPHMINNHKLTTSESLGLGFVRAIDVNNETFKIITPLSSNQFQRVNCLQIGISPTPKEIIMSNQDAELPYNGYPVLTSASSANVGRRTKPKAMPIHMQTFTIKN